MSKFKLGDIVFVSGTDYEEPDTFHWGVSGDIGIIDSITGDSAEVKFPDYVGHLHNRTWSHSITDMAKLNKRNWCRVFLEMMNEQSK